MFYCHLSAFSRQTVYNEISSAVKVTKPGAQRQAEVFYSLFSIKLTLPTGYFPEKALPLSFVINKKKEE